MTIKQSLKKYSSNFFSYSANLGLFIILPLLVILFLGEDAISFELNKNISKVSIEIDNSLNDIESEVNPELFLLKVARGAWFSFKNYERELNNYWLYINSLKNYLNSEIDTYVFNEKGDLITPQSINLKSRFLVTKLWGCINSSYDEKVKISEKYKKSFSNVLGREFKIGLFMESRNQLLPIIVNNREGYVYWMNSVENTKKGILLIFWEIPSFDCRFQHSIKRYSSNFDRVFTRNEQESIKIINNKDDELSESSCENIFVKTVVLNENNLFIENNDLLWKSIKLNDLWLLVAKKSNKNKYLYYDFIFKVVLLLIFLLIICVYLWFSKKQDFFIPIKIKLVTLFLFAVFTPVMGFSYLGYRYISDMRENLITDFRNESRKILLSIDREVGNSGDVFIDEFRKMVSDFYLYDNNPSVKKSFTDRLDKQDLAIIEKRSIEDASVKQQITNRLIFEDMNLIMKEFAKLCIDSVFDTNLTSSSDPLLKSTLLNTPESAFTGFVTRPDKVHNIVFGDLDFYLYWCINEKNNEKDYFFVLRKTTSILNDYIKKRLEECKDRPKEKKYKIFACCNKSEKWLPDNYLGDRLNIFSRRINLVGKPVESEIIINNKPYLLLGLKSGKLKDYSFYALYPYEKIGNKLKTYSYSIVAFVFLFIITALAIGLRLSHNFIKPVNSLELGIQAIKKRETDFRIEKLQNDEFGELAVNFNKMISNLKEMELAKCIQESLLPKEKLNLELKGYQISYDNMMASAIGGDYFDVFLLDEDNLCLIIGDVSGHGVASALVMAIAKAILYQGFKESRDLISLFSDLNTVINTYFNKRPVKKMITLFGTIINLPTGESVFIDLGHNFPMKISKDGNITELAMIGTPVGSMKKLRNKSLAEYTIKEGESIVFYTDGIIEVCGANIEQYGYKRFSDSLSLVSDKSSDDILKILFDNYYKWKDGAEAEDDVTLIVLKRLSSQNNEGNIIG